MNDARDETGISEGSCLLFYSLLSFRKTIPREDLDAEYASLRRFLHESGLSATGPCIGVLHEGPSRDAALFLDLEILVPIPGEIAPVAPYSFVPRLKIGNAVSTHYEGPIDGLRARYDDLYRYIRTRNLGQATGIYHVLPGDGAMPAGFDPLSVDIYIAVRRKAP